MKTIYGVQVINESNEELLPDFSEDFPYIATCAQLGEYDNAFIPWHWHKAVEIFFLEKGTLEYETPTGKITFSENDGGFVNSNILHRTHTLSYPQARVQKLHIFDTSLISGPSGGKTEQIYFIPIIANPSFEIMPFFAENSDDRKIIKLIRDAFLLDEKKTGYELRLQRALLELWLKIYQKYQKEEHSDIGKLRNIDAVKSMMIYIREHLAESIRIKDLADSAFISERECYRIFNECLHTTPANYIIDRRLQRACEMLAYGNSSITDIAYSCGFSSGSYFSRIFSRRMGIPPNEYRASWQDSANYGR